jgi:poly(A) polymerase
MMDDEREPARHLSGSPRVIPADSIPSEVLDQDALRVISRLERQGYEAYLVGGCVRDLLVGRIPKDYDVATDAHPRQIKRLFRNGRIIGRRFRLVHIYYGQHIVETATFRRDPDRAEPDAPDPQAEQGGDLDVPPRARALGRPVRDAAGDPRSRIGRSAGGAAPRRGARVALETGDDLVEPGEPDPEDLLITEDNVFGTAEEDARRRDFTVNALFLDPTRRRIIDYVGGLEDLEKGILCTIGDATVRMAEDPVRILRAVKFATRLGFRIEDDTWSAMCALAPSLSRSAPPRVLEEILRLMRSGTALGAMRMLRACGALKVILPGVDHYLGSKDDPKDQERADSFWRLIEALDADVHTGFVPSAAVCVALLYLRIIEREADPATRTLRGPAGDLASVAGEILEPMALATRLSRRDSQRARRIIAHQRRFMQSSTKRFRPLVFMRSEEFPECLDLFRLRMAARGQGWDIYEGWRARYELSLKSSPEEVELERRRARRRPRRRRRGGTAAPPAGPEADEASRSRE